MDADTDGAPRLRRSQRVTQLRSDSTPPFDPKAVTEARQQAVQSGQSTSSSPQRTGSPTVAAHGDTITRTNSEEIRRAGALRAHPQQQADSIKIFKHAWNELDEAEEREANKVSDDYVQGLRRRLSQLEDRNMRLLAHRSSQNLRMRMDPDYQGLRLPEAGEPILVEHVSLMLESFKKKAKLHYSYAHRIVSDMNTLLESTEVQVNQINVPSNAQLIVVGDLHGQLSDLLTLLKLSGLPSKGRWFLFNGDFVDRGNYSTEVLLTIYAFKLALPDCVFLNRGNHEHKLLNSRYNFTAQVKSAYDEPLYKLISKTFARLPYCSVVNDKVFVVHGGLTSHTEVDMKYIRSMDLMEVPREPKTKMEKVMKDLMWSDPVEEVELRDEAATYSATLEKHGYTIDDILEAGWIGSRRGAGILFSHVVTNQFLKAHGYEFMVRSHQMVPNGYHCHHNGALYTLFSASRYCGNNVNMGAFMTLDPNDISKPQFKTYFAESYSGILDYDNSVPASPTPQSPIITQVSAATGEKTTTIAEKSATTPSASTSSPSGRRGSTATSSSAQSVDNMIQETLTRLGEKIFNKRHKLLIEFSRQDSLNTGAIPIDIWEIVMRKVTKLNVPWRSLWPHMRPQTASAIKLAMHDYVAYRKFLDRYTLQIDEKLATIWKSQQNRVAHELLLKIASRQEDVKNAFHTLDTGKTGKISYLQFSEALESLHIGLSSEQIYDFIVSMDTDRDGSISLAEFTERFKETFEKFQSSSTDGAASSTPSNSRNATALLRQLAEKLFSETTPTLSNLKSWFKKADKNGSGRLDFDTFVDLLSLVGLATSWTRDQQTRLFKLIDANSSGEINYREWKKAFSFVILETSQSQRVLSFISRYANELLIGFVTCDVDGVGKLHSVDEFKSVLLPLVELKNMTSEISEETIAEVYQAFADRDGFVQYHKILKSVRVTQKP